MRTRTFNIQSHCKPDLRKSVHRGGKLSLEGCVSKMALLDMSQLIWLHLRRGELGMAQERCRKASGRPEDNSGGRQWWRAALLEGAGFSFEPSQRAAFANSDYKTWYEKRYQESYHFESKIMIMIIIIIIIRPIARRIENLGRPQF